MLLRALQQKFHALETFVKAHEVAETVIRCLKVHAGLTSARQVPRVVSALSTAISKPLEHNIQSEQEEFPEVELSSEKSEVGCCFRPVQDVLELCVRSQT